MIEKKYHAPDVSCHHCKNAIEGAVGALPGVAKVDVDVQRKEVDIVFDEGLLSEGEIVATLEEEGYPVAD